MAIVQVKTLELSDATELPIAGQVDLPIVTRLRELHFAFPSEENCRLVFEPFLNGPGGKKRVDVEVRFGKNPQPPQPSENMLDPETGAVLVPAGGIWPAMPSMAEMLAMPLPEGLQQVATFGDLLKIARRQIYLKMVEMMPLWSDGTVEE